MGDNINPAALGTEDAARYMSISTPTFRIHVAPDLRPAIIGARKVWLRQDLDQWLERATGRRPDAETAIPQNPLDALM